MLDIDYCNGKNCSLNNVCQRYADYLHRIEMKQDVCYARGGTPIGECEQFIAKGFIGN